MEEFNDKTRSLGGNLFPKSIFTVLKGLVPDSELVNLFVYTFISMKSAFAALSILLPVMAVVEDVPCQWKSLTGATYGEYNRIEVDIWI